MAPLDDVEYQYILLSEALDVLDRLYDGESAARDAQAVLKLAGLGLTGRALEMEVLTVAAELATLVLAAHPAKVDKMRPWRLPTRFGARSPMPGGTFYVVRYPPTA